MAKYKSEVVLTCNGKKVEDVLKTLRQMAADVKKEMDSLDPNIDATKIEALKKKFDLLNSAEASTIEANERLQHAIDNLASTSLQNLKKALGDGRRELQGLSEDQLAEAEAIRKKMKIIGDEVRLLEGQYVKIEEGIEEVSHQSDQWLDKAIKQQKELLSTMKPTGDEYKQQLTILKQLTDEESRRMGKATSSFGVKHGAWEIARTGKYRETDAYGNLIKNDAGEYITRNASLADLKVAKQRLIDGREMQTSEHWIKEYTKMIDQIDERMKALTGTAKMTKERMKEVWSNPKGASRNDLNTVLKELNDRLNRIPVGSKHFEMLSAKIKELEKVAKGVKDELVDVNDVIRRSKTGKASIDELKKAYKQLEDELNKINTADPAFKNKQKDLKALKKQIDEVTGAANKQSSSWSTAAKNLVAYVGLFGAFNMLKEKITEAINGNLKYSDSLANIRKVSGLAKKDIADLSKELAKIDTRTSQEEMANIAYTGAKLGMGKYGTQGLVEFTEAANKVNVALKEDMGEDALKNLSKMVEVMGLIPKMGVEKSMMATSSALFKLASTSTASADQVVEFSKRLTGMSRTAGITTDQLLALGSASDSMMLMPEVASTAFSKLIAQLQRAPGAIEESLQIPKGTIDNLYSSGKAMDAIVMILEKMKQKGNMNALDDVFKDLGSDGARLISVMVTMSKNVDMLKSHLYESKTAFEEATAVEDEYLIQQETAQAKMERAANIWQETFISPTQIENVDWMASAWLKVSEALNQNVIFSSALQATMTSLYAVTTAFVAFLPTLATALAMGGVAYAVSQWASVVGNLKEKIDDLKEAWQGLDKAVKTTSWIGIIVTVGSLLYNLYELGKASDVAAESQRKLSEYHREGAAAAAEESRKLDEYIRALESVNTSQRTREELIAQFNREYGTYINKLGIEIKTVDDLRDAYAQLNDEIKKKAMSQMRDQAYKDILDPLYKKTHEIGVNIDKALEGIGGGAINRRYIDMTLKEMQSGLHEGEGIKHGDIMSEGSWMYRRLMTNKYGSAYNPKTNKVTVNGKAVSSINGVSFDDLRKNVIQYVGAKTNETRSKDTIDKEFENELGNWNEFEVEILGHLHDKTPKGRSHSSSHSNTDSQRDIERAWREELKQKQDEANAIMDNVRNFYERQINVKLTEAIGLGMDKTEQDLYVEPVKRRMNEALEQVRLAVAGQANTWEEFKETMKNDLIEQTDETGINLSQTLLDSITANNIDALRAKLQQLGDNLSKPLNSIMAEIFAKATKNAQDNLKLELQQQDARRKAAQEHDYTGVVQQNIYDDFNLMGYANPTEAELADEEAFNKRKEKIIELYEKARKQITSIMATDVSTDSGRAVLMYQLFGMNEDEMGKEIRRVLGDSEEQWQAFYRKLIQYNDEYTEAEKKGFDERRKNYEFMWKRDLTQKAYQSKVDEFEENAKESSRQYSFGAKADVISPWGQTEARDPELALLQLKMSLAKKYYEYIKKHGATEEEMIAAAKEIQGLHSSLMDTIVAKAKATAEAQMKWYKPIEQYGTALGEAMMDESKTVKDATKDMINSFIDLTGEYVQQKLTQWIMTKLYNTFIAESENELAAQKQANAVTNATTAVTEAGVEVAAGTAAASAKTLGTLGWWGIPLIAVIGGVLGGLMALAKGALSKAFGSKTPDTGNTNTKVVSGMLTYDSGNVSSVLSAPGAKDLHPFFDKDGNMYWATEDDTTHRGVSLLTTPTATTINGRPSLVAEKGPELVIGRETTAAMMQNNPALLRAIYQFDRNHSGRTAYDQGNLSSTLGGRTYEQSAAPNAVNTQGDSIAVTNAALLTAVEMLLARLNEPISAKIDMYGRGNLYDSMTKANQFMKGKS